MSLIVRGFPAPGTRPAIPGVCPSGHVMGIAMKTSAFKPVVPGLLFAVLLVLGGCREEACANCGTIESITPRVVQGDTSGGGAVAGAIVGGVVGHQFGSGRGNDAATVAGAVGGAVAGNEIERSRKRSTVYDVAVRMEKGELRHFTLGSTENLREGDRVRVEGDRVVTDSGST